MKLLLIMIFLISSGNALAFTCPMKAKVGTDTYAGYVKGVQQGIPPGTVTFSLVSTSDTWQVLSDGLNTPDGRARFTLLLIAKVNRYPIRFTCETALVNKKAEKGAVTAMHLDVQ